MKRSDNTEMDRLLRRHARRGGEALLAKSDAVMEASGGAHLDADEMNAYAEGALPEAARSLYFVHLADCDSCRKLVTELTLAASREDEGKARVASLEDTPSKSWRERLAVIFSPAVLRYGVPALALFAVIIIAIVAMRPNRNEPGVALNAEQARYSHPGVMTNSSSNVQANSATGTAGSQSNSNVAPSSEAQNQPPPQPDAAATPLPPTISGQLEDKAPVLSKTTNPSSETAPVDDTKDRSGRFGETPKREQPEVAAAAPASPPPPVSQETGMSRTTETEVTSRDVREEQKENKVGGKVDTDEIAVGGRNVGGVAATQRAGNEPRADVGRATTTRAAQAEARKRPAAAAKSGPAATDQVTEKERSTETRSVGGRRFRRQGSAWVDTAYNSSRPVMNVARGSEQYRALVADAPALRRIAEGLGGEIIVVWQSRAYRFY
jgi:hypothetical protein